MTEIALAALAIAAALVVGFLVGVRRERRRIDAVFWAALGVVASPTLRALYCRFLGQIDDEGLRKELVEIVTAKEERRRIREGSGVE